MKFPPPDWRCRYPVLQVPKTCDTLRESQGSGLPVWIQEKNCLYKQMKIITDPSPAKKGETARHKNLLHGWLFWTYYNVHWDKTTSGRWQWFSLGNYNCHDYKLKSFSNSKSKNKQKNWSYLGDLQLYTLKINNTLLAFSFSWLLLPWVEIDHSYLLLDNYFSEQHGISFSSTKTDSAISKLDFAFRKA